MLQISKQSTYLLTLYFIWRLTQVAPSYTTNLGTWASLHRFAPGISSQK